MAPQRKINSSAMTTVQPPKKSTQGEQAGGERRGVSSKFARHAAEFGEIKKYLNAKKGATVLCATGRPKWN